MCVIHCKPLRLQDVKKKKKRKKKKERAGGVAQVVERLPSICEGSGFHPQHRKRKKIKQDSKAEFLGTALAYQVQGPEFKTPGPYTHVKGLGLTCYYISSQLKLTDIP
jgi:hypothetical protein